MKKFKNNKFPIITIAAISNDFIIGDGSKMLWHLPNDLQRLKNITIGNPLIMGRKTFDSIGKPLVGRANIILSRNVKIENDPSSNKYFATNFENAIFIANKWIDKKFNKNEKKTKQIFIFGGGEIYKFALKYSLKIELTKVNVNLKEGVCFPKINEKEWDKKLIEQVNGSKDSPSHSFWTYSRKLINFS